MREAAGAPAANTIVLLAVNARYIHSSLSVWALAGGLLHFSRSGARAQVVEATINQDAGAIVAQVAAHASALVGVSTYIWNAHLLPDILSGLRAALPGVTVVLGGPEAGFNAEHWLRQGADFVLRGEGERSFAALADALFAGDTLAGVPGLCRLRQGHMVENAQPRWTDTPPDPYTPQWAGALGGRIAYLETSRGCPFSCAFCLSGREHARFFPIQRAKQQLLALSCSGAQTVKLVDRTFNADAERAYQLLEYVIGLETGCCFHFEVAADLFDARTIALLNTAPPGRIQLEAGLQSFHQPTLDAVSRRTDLGRAAENLRAILSAGNIHVHVDLIAGLPLEGFAQLQDSFGRAYALGAHTLQLGFLKLLHGSALRAQAPQLGIRFEAQPPYEIIDNPWITARELDTLRQTADALEHAHNSGRFTDTLAHVLAATGMHPFDLYRGLGERVPHGGMPLMRYAEELYAYFCGLPGVLPGPLREAMVCDLLAATRGESLPPSLRVPDPRRRLVAAQAAQHRGQAVPRREVAVLPGRGQGVFVGDARSPVTGRFALQYVPLPENG